MEPIQAVVKEPVRWRAPLALLALCLAIASYRFFVTKSGLNNFAYLLGRDMVHAMLVWALFRFTVLARSPGPLRAISYFAILAAFIGGDWGSSRLQRTEWAQAAESLQGEVSRIASEIESTGGAQRSVS